ncbi:MAG: 50S ribosomal protein L29 [Candidatus Staskawiczbacteria bacterium]|jgi:large subunit ribosomal protein L29
MKAQELQKMNIDELKKNLHDKKEHLGDLLFKVAANKLKDVKAIKNTKKDIARILTIMKQK